MNDFDIKKKLGTEDKGKSDSLWGDWKWRDCRLYSAVKAATEYFDEDDHPYKDNIETWKMMFGYEDLNILIMQGELDYQVNYVGLESTLSEFNVFDGGLNLSPWSFKNEVVGDTVEGGQYAKGKNNVNYIRVKDAGLRIYHEKPELMYWTLKKWIATGEV